MLDFAPLIFIFAVFLAIQATVAQWVRYSCKPEVPGLILGWEHFPFFNNLLTVKQ